MQIGNLVKKRKKNEALFYVAFALLTGYGCNSSSSAPDAGYAPQIQSLPVITVMDTTAATYKEFSASLEGSKDIEIRPQVDGYLDKIYVDEGAYVSKGQSLFHINDRPYVEQLNNAKASLAVAKANLVTAEINVNKITPLVQNNIVSDVQLKEAQASYDAMAASVAQAQALVQSAGINLGYTLVKAPVTGYIGRLHHKTGSLVGLTTSGCINSYFRHKGCICLLLLE
jgi:membrane fusion protein (multidrug efflux system)